MAKLAILITESIPSSVRGEITRWMLEIKTGIFVGTLSALVREKLWEYVCKRTKGKGLILIHPTNNEQRFLIHMHGKTSRKLVDFEGIQLIKTLHRKKRISVPEESTSLLDLKKVAKDQPNHFLDLPENFIIRSLISRREDTAITFEYKATSAYHAITSVCAWIEEWNQDIERINRLILNYLVEERILQKPHLKNKKIVSLDIETTNYLPKAYEGHVNIIAVSVLDLRNKLKALEINTYQAFNMERKKEHAYHLIRLIDPLINDTDILIVFNKDFDISILKSIIVKYNLKIKLCSNIIDYADQFKSLKALEEVISDEIGFRRTKTKKGEYNVYYEKFKGKGRKKKDKQLEPIGTYNIMDTLTPLLYYIYFS